MGKEPNFAFEKAAYAAGALRVAGVDEVGRGPLAGPVTACAVILDPKRIPEGLNDSKKLSVARRDALTAQIKAVADFAVVHAPVEMIDEINILQASLWAMGEALRQVGADHALIDGTQMPKGLHFPAETIKKGDGRVLSIAAASILAKTARDQIMVDLAQQHPGYGWETNMGYGTSVHFRALSERGPTPHHRRSFKPIRNIL